MSSIRVIGRYAIIAMLLVLIWLFVYLMNGTSGAYVHAFYFPILLAAGYWGIKGGSLVGVIAGLLAGPLMLEDVANDLAQHPDTWIIRMAFFIICGFFQGKFLETMTRKNNEITEQRDEIKSQEERLGQFTIGLVDSLASAIEVRDSYTSGHCFRVAEMSVLIGKQMGLEQLELLRLRWSATLHDIGKIGVPEAILTKEGKLTTEEYQQMKQHPELGRRILNDLPHADTILAGVMHHHERMDGKGYPYGLSGDQIELQARIIAVCDVWDAITSKRSYRDALLYEDALKIMESGRGTQFDPFVLDLFLAIITQDRNKESQSEVV